MKTLKLLSLFCLLHACASSNATEKAPSILTLWMAKVRSAAALKAPQTTLSSTSTPSEAPASPASRIKQAINTRYAQSEPKGFVRTNPDC